MDAEDAERYWGHRIANHRLTSGLLPGPDTDPHAIAYFASTFDGYSVRRDLRTLLPEAFHPWFERERRLPELSLSMARALLFGFARWDHHGGGGGFSRDSDWWPCIRALVERIRQRVAEREAGVSPATPRVALEDGIMDAYERTLEEYARWGGYRFHGWTDFGDPHNFQGPVVWSEADCTLRLALELERQFPRAIHAEFAVGKATRLDYDPELEKRQRVDLVISELSSFAEDETSQERFQTLAHEAFFEVKWLVKGWRGGRFEQDATRRVASVYADIERLRRHLELGRCRVAAVVVFDDEDYFSDTHPPDDDEHLGTPGARPVKEFREDAVGPVWRLVIGPQALRHRRLLADV